MNYENLRLKKPEDVPTPELLKATFGDSYKVYETFLGQLGGLELEQDWKYYNCSCKSWLARGQYRWTTPRGANKEKTIYWLSAWDGYFKVAIWFLGKNRMEILNADVSDKTKRMITEAKTLGKMNTFPLEFDVTDNEPLADICTLIKYKKQLET